MVPRAGVILRLHCPVPAVLYFLAPPLCPKPSQRASLPPWTLIFSLKGNFASEPRAGSPLLVPS